MHKIINLNSAHLNYLEPLLKWRILDIDSLRKETNSVPKYKYFQKIVRSLESQKILEGYRDPYNRKKYVYLSPFGESKLSIKENPAAVSHETLIHDIKVIEFVRALFEAGLINEINLEHQLRDRQNNLTFKVIPDAVVNFHKNGFDFNIAIELELTRKNNQRIIEKMRQYKASSNYHYLIYLFPTNALMNKYISVIKEALGEDGLSKTIFLYHPDLSRDIENLHSISGIYKNKEIKLMDIFRGGD
jgi:DNA-binding MarR family transcriptional regulator